MLKHLDNEFDKYEFVKYRPDLQQQILELQTYLWGQDVSLNSAYLEWKYEQNPYLKFSLIYAAMCAERVVGMVGAYGAKWQVGIPRHTFICPCFGDAVIHPDHRNQGLFRKMMTFALDDLTKTDFKFVFDFSARPEIALVLMMNGWRSPGFFQTAHILTAQGKIFRWLRRILNLFHVSTFTAGRLSGFMCGRSCDRSVQLDRAYDQLQKNGTKYNLNSNSPISVARSPRPKAMAKLVERLADDGRIQHVKDESYFGWRFQNPLSRYHFVFWDDPQLEGYLVLQTPKQTDGTWVSLNVVDWEAANLDILSGLFQAVIRLGAVSDLTLWSSTLSKEKIALLRRQGFSFVNKTGKIAHDIQLPTMFTKYVCPDASRTEWGLSNRSLLDLTNWNMRMIYSDNF
jgi:hypothetical protein